MRRVASLEKVSGTQLGNRLFGARHLVGGGEIQVIMVTDTPFSAYYGRMAID